MAITYQESGVDRDKGDAFVERIRKMVATTYGPEVQSGVGGFASLFELDDGRLLAAGCDGVGTKLKLAQALDKHDTIGVDLVAMCANDVICTGARPLFFLDYFATGKLELDTSEAVVKGIVDGCKQSKLALVGGETAEMPGMYAPGEYDLAGFCVGEVKREELVDGSRVEAGDELVALASSGIHSNGFSLVRKLVDTGEKDLALQCLTPTRIYVRPILAALAAKRASIKGFAHITGSGFLNVPRINSEFSYRFDKLPEIPPLFRTLQERAELGVEEMYATFNMGVGFVIAVKRGEGKAMAEFLSVQGEKAFVAGAVEKGKAGEIAIRSGGKEFVIS